MEDLSVALGAARAALMQGDKTTARAELATVLRADPRNAQAWLLMSGIVATPEQQRDCLARVLAIDPANTAAQRGLAALEAAAAPASPPAAFSPPPAPAAGAVQVRPLTASADDQWRPPSGLRRLGGAPSPTPPTPAEPYAPTAPASSGAGTGWPQPAAPSGGMQPTAPLTGFGPAPAVPDLYAPQYGPGTGGFGPPAYPVASPRRSQRPLLLVTIGLFAFAFTLFSLRMVRNANKATPPPTPKISAEDRATGFINGIIGQYNNPQFFNEATIRQVLQPTVDRYISPRKREAFFRAMETEVQTNPSFSTLRSRGSLIKQVYVAHPRYSVAQQTTSTITLDVVGGEMWVILKDGQTFSDAMQNNFRRVYLENIDGVWYVTDMGF